MTASRLSWPQPDLLHSKDIVLLGLLFHLSSEATFEQATAVAPDLPTPLSSRSGYRAADNSPCKFAIPAAFHLQLYFYRFNQRITKIVKFIR